MDRWIEARKPNIAPSTYDGYAKNIRKIRGYFGSDIALNDLSCNQIKDFYADMQKSGLSANTVRHLNITIHSDLKEAVDRELIKSNPAENISLPKIQKYTAAFCNTNELQELFKAFEGDRMELVVHIAAYYGFCKSEIVGLRWDTIDFENKTITVQHKITNSYGKGGETLIKSDTLKTESSRRTLPLIPHIENILHAEKEKQSRYKELLKGGYCQEYDGYM